MSGVNNYGRVFLWLNATQHTRQMESFHWRIGFVQSTLHTLRNNNSDDGTSRISEESLKEGMFKTSNNQRNNSSEINAKMTLSSVDASSISLAPLSPVDLAINQMLRQQIQLTRHLIASQYSMYKAYTTSVKFMRERYKPVTLNETKKTLVAGTNVLGRKLVALLPSRLLSLVQMFWAPNIPHQIHSMSSTLEVEQVTPSNGIKGSKASSHVRSRFSNKTDNTFPRNVVTKQTLDDSLEYNDQNAALLGIRCLVDHKDDLLLFKLLVTARLQMAQTCKKIQN
uniref:DUF4614 domain-containing protein n=1 Tax=Timema bartmani TaxID=61472 RepID=A0A7R9I500_9NEOP|nr:unnamed protein product [Timema bartmani]